MILLLALLGLFPAELELGSLELQGVIKLSTRMKAVQQTALFRGRKKPKS